MKKLVKKISDQMQKNSLIAGIGIITIIVSLIAIFFTITQVSAEQQRLIADLQYRSSLLANSLKESVQPNFINQSDKYLQNVVNKFADKQRIAGLAVVDNTGKMIAITSSFSQTILNAQSGVTDVMDADHDNGKFILYKNKHYYIFAIPLHEKKSVVGALVIIQNASYIDNRLTEIWTSTFIRLLIQILLLGLVILLGLHWVIFKPIQSLVTALKEIRLNTHRKRIEKLPYHPLFKPLLQEVSSMQQSLIKARLAASEEAKLSLEKLDSPWTEERLKQFTKDILKDRKVIAVSNLEPYIHSKEGNTISYHTPASGLITAIEPVMEACRGLWIAQGSGNADKLVVDTEDKILAPPDDPKYTLKRIWLSEEEERGYNYGFSDQAMYPLCHMTHIRPIFREDDWDQYKKVNQKFTNAILEEIKKTEKPLILLQDFQFTLVPQMIKQTRPDVAIGIFWHIPWVSAEAFSICPWKKEIIEGMLGSDLLGFHTQQHCNNFIETVSREHEALIDYEQFSVTRHEHTTIIKPFPISIAFSNDHTKKNENEREKPETQKLLKDLDIHSRHIGIGADRLDYIKGLQERMIGLELFFETYPEYIEKLTFIQISSPSETKSKEYHTFAQSLSDQIEQINNRFKTKSWKPIIFLPKHHSHKELIRYYKIADFCLVTSLHDGMNLVAKEFVANRNDENGVLILSQFAGAAKELKEALIINPYNGKQTADAIHRALTMPQSEKIDRMKKMRSVVKNYNIYRWSAEFLKTLAGLK